MRLDTRTWALIPLAVAINIAFGWITSTLKLPLYMDSIGTILVACLTGPLAGAITGAISNLITTIINNPAWLFYVPVAAILGWCTGWIAKRGFMSGPFVAALGGLLIGVLAAALSAPITATVFHGSTGSGTDFVVAAFRALGFSTLEACTAQGLLVDPLDKMTAFVLIQTLLAALPLSLRKSFRQGEELGEMRSLSIPGLHLGRANHGTRRTVSFASRRTELFIPGNSFLYLISPATKMLMTLTCMLAAFTLPVWQTIMNPETGRNMAVPTPYLPIIAALLLGLAIFGGVGLQLSKVTLIMGLPISISMVGINGFFSTAESHALIGHFLHWSVPGAISASDAAFRIVIIIEAAALMLLTTRHDVLLNDLERRGLPPRLAYVLLASLNLIPAMIRRSSEILEAQTSRAMPLGTDWLSRTAVLLPMAGPLLLGAVSEAEERALALEARGFGAFSKRTWLKDPPRSRWDLPCQITLLGLALLCILHLFFNG